MQALLEMIEPTDEELKKDQNAGGSVSYRTANEFYDFVVEYVNILNHVIYTQSNGLNATEELKTLEKFERKNKL